MRNMTKGHAVAVAVVAIAEAADTGNSTRTIPAVAAVVEVAAEHSSRHHIGKAACSSACCQYRKLPRALN